MSENIDEIDGTSIELHTRAHLLIERVSGVMEKLSDEGQNENGPFDRFDKKEMDMDERRGGGGIQSWIDWAWKCEQGGSRFP